MLNQLKVCIVGAGPAGLYTAKYLKQSLWNKVKNGRMHLTLMDQLPTPYGLVRYGVAPDHPEVKNVSHEFHQMLLNNSNGDADENKTFSFIGNVKLGQTVSLKQLQSLYDIVVLSYGASHTDHLLNIENEDRLSGIISARDVVNWYNVLPEPYASMNGAHDKIAQWLRESQHISIIGQGNVALDVARVFARTPDEFLNKEYDISHRAYELLKDVYHSRLISLIGRRGPAQAACTTKELRELLNLHKDSGRDTLFMNERNMSLVKDALSRPDLSRPVKRLLQVFEQAKPLTDDVLSNNPYPKVEFDFCKKPVAFLPSKKDKSKVGGIKCEIMELVKKEDSTDDFSQCSVVSTGEFDVVDTDLVIRSIGYKSDTSIEGVPYDRQGRVLNEGGKVQGSDNLYVSGWLKRGASGVILSNIVDAKETVETIVNNVDNKLSSSDKSSEAEQEKQGDNGLIQIAKEKHVPIVFFPDWMNIDKEEERRGEAVGLKRIKMQSIDEMIHHISQNNTNNNQ